MRYDPSSPVTATRVSPVSRFLSAMSTPELTIADRLKDRNILPDAEDRGRRSPARVPHAKEMEPLSGHSVTPNNGDDNGSPAERSSVVAIGDEQIESLTPHL
jgi:hypothetical protein